MSDIFVKVATPGIDDEEIDAVTNVLRSGRFVSGAQVRDFEKEFSQYIGVKEAVATNSGTAALHCALAATGVGLGDEVIVPALTFFSTVTSVIHQAGVPVFADISPDTFSMTAKTFRDAISDRTKAVIPVHYFGMAAEITEIRKIAHEKGIVVVEDCAQAHGTTYDGDRVGGFGDYGAFSFYATKHLSTGEGGIVTTNDPQKAEMMRFFRSHGLVGRHDHEILGYNYRMTEMAAAMGRVQLKKLEQQNEMRISHSQKIIEQLQDVEWMSLPKPCSRIKHTYFWLHGLIDEEKLGMSTQELISELAKRGVETRNRYLEPLYKQPLMTKNLPDIVKISAGSNIPDYGNMFLPIVEKIAGRVIGLPNRPDMSEQEIEWVLKVVKSI